MLNLRGCSLLYLVFNGVGGDELENVLILALVDGNGDVEKAWLL